MAVFKLPCSCGKHEFVFAAKPHKLVEVKCSECGKMTTYDPGAKPPKFKEDDK